MSDEQRFTGHGAERLEREAAHVEYEAKELKHEVEELKHRAEGLEREAERLKREAEQIRHHHNPIPPPPPPRPVVPPRVHGFGVQVELAEAVDWGSANALPLFDFYPDFVEIQTPPDSGAERAFLGMIRPFDDQSDVLQICADLRSDRMVEVQTGRLRHGGDCPGPHLAHPTDAWMINMKIEFEVLALQFSGGRQPQAYAVAPEVSRQRFPLHPHLRDDLDIFWRGRYCQSLCSYFAPDEVCQSLVDLLDFTSIFLAKHLMWEKTRRLIDRRSGQILRAPAPGAAISDTTEPRLGTEYSVHAAPVLNRFVFPGARQIGWAGIWPGSAAPHDPDSNLALPPDSLCPCGSGRKYESCHRASDLASQGLNGAWGTN